MFGDSAPFFALVGVSLASGDGMLTKDDELEAVCWEIRVCDMLYLHFKKFLNTIWSQNAVSRFQNKVGEQDIVKRLDEELGLDNLTIGPPLAKGCSAVVYAAALNEETESNDIEISGESNEYIDLNAETEQLLSPARNMNRYVHDFGGSADNLHGSFHESPQFNAVGPLQRNLHDMAIDGLQKALRQNDQKLEDKPNPEKKQGRVRFESENESFANRRSRLLSDAVEEYLYVQSNENDVIATVRLLDWFVLLSL